MSDIADPVDPVDPVRLPLVVMGVAGSGKSTLGAALAQSLHLPFIEGDDLHDAHNVRKMHSGQPLDDADRAGWLGAIAARLHDEARYPRGVVITCSALKGAYRDRLRRATRGLRFLFVDIDASTARQRLQQRPDHFMPASLAPSQFAALERPTPDESDIVRLDARAAPSVVMAAALEALRRPPRVPSAPDNALE